MSCDGSSAKSYIRHTTEKERLDNLAFASFPEDYLPYAAPGHQRNAGPPPYLLWGEDRRRRPVKKRRKPKCAGALLCAIALVVVAILAVVAISVYLGVVTNLFRSPVVSVSGRFLASEDFTDDLLNTSSSKFLQKAELYQAKVEKAFLSSSLEPAFIAARVYSFRPGLVVFFRVYLDRRKIKQNEEDSPPSELVRALVAQKLTADPESVHIEENEELLSDDLRPIETIHLQVSTTPKPTTERNGHQKPPASGGVGEWRPVPIEDSVSPSFADRLPGSVGSVRSPEEFPIRNPNGGLGSVRVTEDSLRNPQVSPPNREGIGSVRVLEESLVKNPLLRQEGSGSVRRLEEPVLRNTQSAAQNNVGSTNNLKETVKSTLLPVQGEGVGSVRLLPESIVESSQLSNLRQGVGVGSVRLTHINPEDLPHQANEGVGSVRLLDENPITNTQFNNNAQGGIGVVRAPGDTSLKKSPPGGDGFVHSLEDPPTLAPSVSLVIRNRSRSDKLRTLLSRIEKQRINSAKQQNMGSGSVKEVISEEIFPPPLHRDSSAFASQILESSPEATTTDNGSDKHNDTEITEIISETDITETQTQKLSTEVSTNDNPELLNKSETIKTLDNISTKETSETALNSFHTEATVSEIPKETQFPDLKTPLESILFSHPAKTSFITTEVNKIDTTETITTEPTIFKESITTESNFRMNTEHIESNEKDHLFDDQNISSVTENSDEDIHSTIVNYSQYIFTEPFYHTIENKSKANIEDTYEFHILEGHGFHKPPSTNNTVISLSNVESTTAITATSSTESHHTNVTAETEQILPSLHNQSEADLKPSTSYFNDTEVHSNISASSEDVWLDDKTDNSTEEASQQAKIVPQLQEDLLSNDIGAIEELDEEKYHFEDEILRHITTVRPQFNASEIKVQSCAAGSVFCDKTGEGCGVRCDMKKDCPNNEDERDCMCSDLLRAMGQSQKVCDGVEDCSDKSDETNCPWCPPSEYFRCPGSRTCITLDRVCDGKDDCPGAQDERRCVSLAESSNEAQAVEYRPEGYLIVRKSGHWGKLCLDALSRSPDLERRIQDLGKAVCSALTYRNMSTSVRVEDKAESENSYYQISTETVKNRSASSLFEPTTCQGKEVLRVHCKSLECGLRPSAPPTQRRRIVGGRSADSPGSWPWAAALYREGDFQCGAALINDLWLVSAAHCFYSSKHAYWSARLGVLRRGSELLSGGEQVRKIDNIILHPQYEDVGFINDIALLRMDRAVPFSDLLRPICLPSSPSEDASLWHGRRCSVIGWGKLYEIGHTFPDTLQEVRLPVISSSECHRRSIFLPAYRITPNMFCAGFDRGGRDACLGDSGGPMACQRPADGRWVLLGVTSNGDGCGRPGRPGVYSQVAGFLTWIQETISDETALIEKTFLESSCSRGMRCRLGRCLPQSRICDGKRDCADGEDENSC